MFDRCVEEHSNIFGLPPCVVLVLHDRQFDVQARTSRSFAVRLFGRCRVGAPVDFGCRCITCLLRLSLGPELRFAHLSPLASLGVEPLRRGSSPSARVSGRSAWSGTPAPSARLWGVLAAPNTACRRHRGNRSDGKYLHSSVFLPGGSFGHAVRSVPIERASSVGALSRSAQSGHAGVSSSSV